MHSLALHEGQEEGIIAVVEMSDRGCGKSIPFSLKRSLRRRAQGGGGEAEEDNKEIKGI